MGRPNAYILPRALGTWALVLGLTLGSMLARPGRAQPGTASHTVTITVQEVTQIELADDLSTEVKQGETETMTSNYSVLINTSNPRVIRGTAETDGGLTGVEMAVEMEAPADGSTSRGQQVILDDGEGQTQVLVEDLKGVSASGIDLTYVVAASMDTPPGTTPVSVTYTISAE